MADSAKAPTHKEIAAYVRTLVDAMGLRDWDVELEEVPCDSHAHGTIFSTYGRKHAALRLQEGFESLSPEKQRFIIVHELTHPHFAAAESMVRTDLEALLGASADVLFWSSFRRTFEYGIDGIASVVAKHMPLPKWA